MTTRAALDLAPLPTGADVVTAYERGRSMPMRAGTPSGQADRAPDGAGGRPDLLLLRAAAVMCQDAAARGERLSQRALARQLRQHGHRFPNQHLRLIATSIGLAHGNAA
jgi:hypothetical protein